MNDTPKMIAARIEAERAKAEMVETVQQLQQRLAPKTLATEAWEKAKNKGADLAEEAVDAVRSRPAAAGGVVAALALLLARKPIKDAAVHFYDAMTSKDEPDEPSPALNDTNTEPTSTRPRPRSPSRRKPKTEKAT